MKKILPVFLLILFISFGGFFLFRFFFLAEVSRHDTKAHTTQPQETQNTRKSIPSDQILPAEEWGNYFENLEPEAAFWAKSISMDNLPVSVTTFWSNVGGVDEKFFSSQEVVLYTFNSLAVLTLGEATGEATDNSIRIRFEMADGTTQIFDFNNENARIRKDGFWGCYCVSPKNGLEKIFSLAKDRNLITNHSITVLDGAAYILDCPDAAHAGTTVSVTTQDITDGKLIVSVNGADLEKNVSESTNIVEFVMPDEDVTLSLRISTEENTGT